MPAGDGFAPRNHPDLARALGTVRAALPERRGNTLPIVVACSGGADSVALLGLLVLLRASDSLRVSVIHVDHGLRPESCDEALAVTSLARQLEVPVDVVRLALPVGSGLPARARRERHGAFAAAAAAAGASHVALGHTQTDQAETVLLHLARGAGLPGLAAMPMLQPWAVDPPLSWWRPLLTLSRAQARAIAGLMALPFVDDPTNEDRRSPRAMVRHEVLPRLARINPAVERALATTAEHARQADAALAVWVDNELVARIGTAPDGSGATAYLISDARGLPCAVRWRLIRTGCQRAGVTIDAMSAKTVESIDAALCAPGPARSWDLHPGTRVRLQGGWLWVQANGAHPRGVRDHNH